MKTIDQAIERIALNASITQAIVKSLVADISGRHGLKSEWEAIDEEVKADIIKEWSKIILSALEANDDRS